MLITEQEHHNDLQNVLAHQSVERLPKKGIIHVGAHQGQEVEQYLNYGFEKIVLVEANPQWFDFLKQKFGASSNIQIFNYAVCDREGPIDLQIHTSRTGSTEPASVLPMKRFKEIVRTLHTPETINVSGITLDLLIHRHGIDAREFNFINIDIQGAEMLALKGGTALLSQIDAVITEVNLIELYEGGSLEEDLVRFLQKFGFTKVNSVYHELYDEKSSFPAWGECLFVKDERFLSAK